MQTLLEIIICVLIGTGLGVVGAGLIWWEPFDKFMTNLQRKREEKKKEKEAAKAAEKFGISKEGYVNILKGKK